MITAIQNSSGSQVMARDVSKSDAPFSCPECKKEVILRKGLVKTHHFAHKPPTTCRYGASETEAHRLCKVAIFDGLCADTENVSNCKLERTIDGVLRPDVSANIHGNRVAIEVQISHLGQDEIIRRTKAYAARNIAVLWLLVWDENLDSHDKRYSPRNWEKWLHVLQYGRVYYWRGGLNITPIHFDEYQLYVESSEWYEQGGTQQSAGGYYRRSKRYRTPRAGKRLHLVNDFISKRRQGDTYGSFTVPSCTLYGDTSPKWW